MISTLIKSALGRLRIVAFLEGVSYLVLLGIAMPLKYIAGIPQAVRVVGMAHGVLFVLVCASCSSRSQ
jgi:integral membrane protein